MLPESFYAPTPIHCASTVYISLDALSTIRLGDFHYMKLDPAFGLLTADRSVSSLHPPIPAVAGEAKFSIDHSATSSSTSLSLPREEAGHALVPAVIQQLP